MKMVQQSQQRKKTDQDGENVRKVTAKQKVEHRTEPRSVHRIAKSDCTCAASSLDVGAGRNFPKSVPLWIAQVRLGYEVSFPHD